MKTIEYDFEKLNEFLNVQDKPENIQKRLFEIMANYARTTDEDSLNQMKDDLDYLVFISNAVGLIKERGIK